MMIKKLFIIAISFIFCLNAANSNAASTLWQENEIGGSKTKLLASFYQDDNGNKKLIAGIHFKIDKGWKIYGNDNSGIGLPPSFDFANSQNIKNYNIIWPQAITGQEDLGDEILKYLYYKNEVIIPIEVDLTNSANQTAVNLKLNYGLCKDICIPATANFKLNINAGEVDLDILGQLQNFTPYALTDSKELQNNLKNNDNNDDGKIKILIIAILSAILGGAILNIMPCVLPILSIKLMSIIENSNARAAQVKFTFLATILGILSCFVVLAILAILIKFSGNVFGWGLQFQNPYFLTFLILVLAIFSANLWGLFEINLGQLLSNFINSKITKSSYKNNIFVPNFLSGILAVLLATPCSAPFLGAAISFALTQDYLFIVIIFAAIGIGFALPYFVLLAYPKLVYLLPKPGKWMLKVKKYLAGLLLLTILWLTYILAGNVGWIMASSITILALLLLPSFKIKSLLFKSVAILAIFAFVYGIIVNCKEYSENSNNDKIWRQFDEVLLQKSIANGKVVVVDITAKWCLTCQFNKVRVLQDKEIVAKLKKNHIIAMRGDITKPSPEIMLYLKKHNRFAIPFNAVYGPNAKNGLLTSELLTKKDLLKLINQAK